METFRNMYENLIFPLLVFMFLVGFCPDVERTLFQRKNLSETYTEVCPLLVEVKTVLSQHMIFKLA